MSKKLQYLRYIAEQNQQMRVRSKIPFPPTLKHGRKDKTLDRKLKHKNNKPSCDDQ